MAAEKTGMTAVELQNRLARFRRYQEARRWVKPWLDPARFWANQRRKRGWQTFAPGGSRAVNTFHLDQFFIVNGEAVSEEIASYGFYEPRLTEALVRLIRPDQVVVDIGMHLGYYASLFSLLVGAGGEVHAFEPTPSTRAAAAPNTERFANLTVHPFAVWSTIGTLPFQDFGREWMAFNSLARSQPPAEAKPQAIEVSSITLDAFCASRARPVSLIKIDAESAELEILKGAAETLVRQAPLLTVEVGDVSEAPQSRKMLDWILGRGYVPWEFRAGGFHRHELRQRYTYDNLILTPRGRDLSQG